MAYTFTSAALDDLQTMLTNQQYHQAYEYIATLLITDDETSTLNGVTVSTSPADRDPAVRQVALWFAGAAQVNSGSGLFSELIRAYTGRQGELRYNQNFTSPQMQLASDQVAINALSNILNISNTELYGKLPNLTTIANLDATGVSQILFGADSSDSAFFDQQNSAWSGTILFSMLGNDQTGKLLGGDNQLNTLNDLRDLLFAYDSFVYAYDQVKLLDGVFNTADDLSVFIKTYIYNPVIANPASGDSVLAQITKGQAAGSALAFIESTSRYKVIDGLRRILFGIDTGSDPTTNANFVQYAYELFSAAETLGVLDNLSFSNTGPSMEAARTDFSKFLSLYYLTPFYVQAGNSATIDTLKQLHASLADQWFADSELNSEQMRNEEANFRHSWYSDRSAMLAWIEERNREDVGITEVSEGPSQLFSDEATQTQILIGSASVNGLERRQFRFGDNNSNLINGANNSDRLYGMGGGDTINGGAGNDLLDGGQGQDTLSGGDGNDLLLGGAGNDHLHGGAGFDLLYGGAENDTYEFSGAFGIDIVSDSDGEGSIIANGEELNSASLQLNGVYKNDLTGYTFTTVNDGSTLVISTVSGSNKIIINNWSSSNNLGITLDDSSPVLPSGNEILGDFKKKLVPLHSNLYATNGPNYISDGAEPNAKDHLNGTEDADAMYGFGGDDYISGFDGNDFIYGGEGNDFLQGGNGIDYIFGGGGHDLIIAGAIIEIFPPQANHEPIEIGEVNQAYTTIAEGFHFTSIHPATFVVGTNGASTGYVTFFSHGEYLEDAASYLDTGSSNFIDAGSGNDYVRGSVAAEYIIGGTGLDFLLGKSGHDTILGGDDNDFIVGDGYEEHERDLIGNDVLDGGAGEDVIIGSAGDDILFGGSENDMLWGDYQDGPENVFGNDFLFGGTGEDQLVGGAGDDYLDGGDDNDILFGGIGNDTLIGGAGADSFIGGEGGDTIYLNIKEGDQILGDRESQDIIIYDIKQTEIQQLTTDLDENGLVTTGIVRIGSLSNQNRSYSFTANSNQNNLSAIGVGLVADADFFHHFGDGDILNSELLGKYLNTQLNFSSEALTMFGGAMDDRLVSEGGSNSTLFGGRGNDRLFGNSGDNVLIGGFGDDIMDGHTGNNLYVFDDVDAPSQYDRVYEGGVASFKFGKGVTLDNINLISTTNSSEVLIQYPSSDGINNSLSITLSLTASIDQFQFEGETPITFEQLITQKVTALNITGTITDENFVGSYNNDIINGGGGTDYIYGGFGNDVLNGEDGTDVLYGDRGDDILTGGAGGDDLSGGEGNDTLTGGAGNDFLTGGNGNDTYYFESGFGVDSITEYSTYDSVSGSYGINTIQLGAGINPADLVFSMNGTNFLTISILGTNDQITGLRYFGVPQTASVSVIKFANGVEWGVNEINDRLFGSTAGSDLIYGFDSEDHINGGLGNDRVYGRNGNDTLVGSLGDDRLFGESGDDVLLGQEDNDYLDGGDGNDLLDGGLGVNELWGQGGNDTIYLGAGNSYANGGRGNDTYKFDLDSGSGSIYNASRNYVIGPDGYYVYDSSPIVDYTDGIELGQGITADNLLIFRNQYDRILFTIYEKSSNVLLYDQLVNEDGVQSLGYEAIDFIKFADGTIWDATSILSHSVLLNNNFSTSWQPVITYGSTGVDDLYTEAVAYGLEGNDQILGSNADNYIVGGIGDDYLSAAEGNDTYVFDAGHGHDIIENLDTQASTSVDQIVFKNINSSSATFTKSGSDLIISTGPNSSITIKDFSVSVDNQIDLVRFADEVTFDAQFLNGVMNAASEGDDVINGTSGDDTIHALGGNDTVNGGLGHDSLFGDAGNDILNGGGGDDLLDGGEGSDQLTGGIGNDTYIVDLTSDIVTEATNAGTDTVKVSIATSGGTYTLGSNIENGILTNSVFYNLTGNSLNNVLTGNLTANILNGGAGTDTLVGGDGDDTYIVDSTTDTITETATGGIDTVQSSVTFTLGATSNLENLTLTGTTAINGTGNALDNILTGNSGNNTLTGGDGNDTLNGASGTDTLVGGNGNDIYLVDSTTDTLTETSTGGNDTVQSSVTFTLGASSNLENLTLTGTTAINGTGNTLNNVITGNSAANTLNGGTGVDTLIGGDGNDIYVVDTTTDTITETSTGGIDTVQSSVAFTLGSNVENLTLTGSTAINGTGNELDNVITGTSGNNILTGGAGNDTLNGAAGTDTLVGGDGNDIYIVDSTTDTVTETSTGGIDTVQSSVTFTLGATSNLENLTLTGTTAINGTGNALNNILTGNSGNNTLTGGDGNDTLNGGAGTDTLVGGNGNDTYIVESTNDTITETSTGGADTVQSSVTYTLGATSNLENLTLTGTTAINGTGNSLTNFLLGNSANNTLTDTAGGNDILQGLGGIDTFNDTSGNNLLDGGIGADVITSGNGRDLIIGGKDNDTITTGNGFDVIMFNKGDGADTINASVGTDNTISLGGNIAYSDLSLTKSASDLILKVGSSDQITLKGWYNTGANNKSVLNLQVVAEAIQGFSLGGSDELRNNKIETFNFANLVAAFDAAGATANWQLTDSRLTAHLSAGSDTSAIGGDIAYQYGKNGSLTDIGLLAAQSVINNANVGQSAQTLNAASSWATETIKLS